MRVLIIEDEILATRLLVKMLQEIDTQIEVIATLDSVEAGVEFLKANPAIDLAFMDVELGDGFSFEIFKQIRRDLPLIFITAYPAHALKAFKLNSLDYLLKPVAKHQLSAAIDKFKQWQVSTVKDQGVNIEKLLKHLNIPSVETVTAKNRYLLKMGNRLISVELDQIAYFYVKERFQYVRTFDNKEYIIDKRLDEIEVDVPADRFFRVNRQFIVNYKAIDKVSFWLNSKLKLMVQPHAGEEIIVGRLRAPEFRKWLGE